MCLMCDVSSVGDVSGVCFICLVFYMSGVLYVWCLMCLVCLFSAGSSSLFAPVLKIFICQFHLAVVHSCNSYCELLIHFTHTISLH